MLDWEDVEHGLAGEGGVAPDGLHPGDISLSLQESVRTGPKEKIRPVHGLGLPPQ